MELTYEESLAELNKIIQQMQSDQCDIDKLAAMTKRAAELLTACRTKLTATEEELRQILATMQE